MVKTMPNSKPQSALFIGLTYIDVTVPSQKIPTGDEKQIAHTYEVSLGGNAVVAALTNAKLGHKTQLLTPIAQDFLGTLIRQRYKEYNITVFERSIEKTSLSVVLPNNNKRAILRCRNTNYTETYPQASLEDIRALHVDGHQADAALYYAKECQKLGILTSLDGGGIKDGIFELLKHIDVAVMSERFAQQMEKTPEETIYWLHNTYNTPVAAITLGEQGILYSIQKGPIVHMPALSLSQDKIIDTTGAGDIFHGAYIASYLKKPEATWHDHFAYGRAASTLAIQRLGTESSIPTKEEMLTFLG